MCKYPSQTLTKPNEANALALFVAYAAPSRIGISNSGGLAAATYVTDTGHNHTIDPSNGHCHRPLEQLMYLVHGLVPQSIGRSPRSHNSNQRKDGILHIWS